MEILFSYVFTLLSEEHELEVCGVPLLMEEDFTLQLFPSGYIFYLVRPHDAFCYVA